jgi:hypothetical protein
VETAWRYLGPGKSLVIMYCKLTTGICGRPSLLCMTWPSKQTNFGDATRLPRGDLRRFADKIQFEEFNFHAYYICTVTKNASNPVRGCRI